MSGPEPSEQPDPSEVQPTDNSTGAPVNLDRLADVEHEQPARPAE